MGWLYVCRPATAQPSAGPDTSAGSESVDLLVKAAGNAAVRRERPRARLVRMDTAQGQHALAMLTVTAGSDAEAGAAWRAL